MTWFRIAYERAVDHAVHDLHADMTARGHTLLRMDKPIAEVGSLAIDPGGMWITGTPVEVFTIGGTPLSIACWDVATYLSQIEALERRFFDDGTSYFKHHSWIGALVMTEHQRRSLLEQMRRRREPATERGTKFHNQYMATLKEKRKS